MCVGPHTSGRVCSVSTLSRPQGLLGARAGAGQGARARARLLPEPELSQTQQGSRPQARRADWVPLRVVFSSLRRRVSRPWLSNGALHAQAARTHCAPGWARRGRRGRVATRVQRVRIEQSRGRHASEKRPPRLRPFVLLVRVAVSLRKGLSSGGHCRKSQRSGPHGAFLRPTWAAPSWDTGTVSLDRLVFPKLSPPARRKVTTPQPWTAARDQEWPSVMRDSPFVPRRRTVAKAG